MTAALEVPEAAQEAHEAALLLRFLSRWLADVAADPEPAQDEPDLTSEATERP